MTYFYITMAVAIAVLSLIHLILKKALPAKTRGEYLIEIMKEKDEELYELMKAISEELGCTLEAVVFTHYAMVKDTETVNEMDLAGENFVILVNDLYSNARKGFLSLELRNSGELTEIAKSLAAKKIVSIPGDYNFSSLDEVFENLIKKD